MPPHSGGEAPNVSSATHPDAARHMYNIGQHMQSAGFGNQQFGDWQTEAQSGGVPMMSNTMQFNFNDGGFVPTGIQIQPPYASHYAPSGMPVMGDLMNEPSAKGSQVHVRANTKTNDDMLSGFMSFFNRGKSSQKKSAPMVKMHQDSSIYESDANQRYGSTNRSASKAKSVVPLRPAKARQVTNKPSSRQKPSLKEQTVVAAVDNLTPSQNKYVDLVDPKIIEEKFHALLGSMPSNPEEIIAMAKPHIELEPDFLTSLGGIYKEFDNESSKISAKIESLQAKLNSLHNEMGKNVPSKQQEPLKIIESVFCELILKEMQDFQDLVNYEHREKRRKFKAVVTAAQKQASKLESKKLEKQLEETKQQRLICKNISNVIGLYWKKIERFAWERLKRELQSTLVEKKRMRLDKFVEDAIKISISKNDKYARRKKSKTSHGKSGKEKGSQQGKLEQMKLSKIEGDGSHSSVKVKIEGASIKQEDSVVKQEDNAESNREHDDSKAVVDEDEFVLSEEMKKMEHDDALLEVAMEEEEEQDENSIDKKEEVNALEDDLNVPIEEILRRYQEEAARFKEVHGVESEESFIEESEEQSSDGDDGEADQAQDEGIKTRNRGQDIDLSQSKKKQSFKDLPSNQEDSQSANDPDAEFTLNDEMFKGQEDEDMNLDAEMSDEHSDNEEGKQERAKEISALEDEANIPIEELLARYKADGGYGDSPSDYDEESEGVVDSYTEKVSSSGSSEAGMAVDKDTEVEEGSEGDSEIGSEGSSMDEDDEIQVPSLIKATLRPYQLEGLKWLASLYRKRSNGILADEMGLGKTLQTIALLAHLACDHGNWGPHLIVVPTSVLINWEMEFKKFCPGFTVLSYYGSPAERAKKRVGWNKQYSFNVCIASYATVVQDAYIMKRKSWVYMVLDEAQNIKNFNSKRWQTLLTFNTVGRILLTGTPLQNSLQELWSLMHFILPEIFSSHSEFKEWFSDPLTESIEREQGTTTGMIKDSQTSDLVNKLHMVLRPYLLRRLKKDVEKQMPSKYEHVIKCFLSRRQRLLYDEFISSRSTVEALSNPSYRSMLFVLMQLRKICNHPDQLQSRPVESPYYDPDMMEDESMPSFLLLPGKGRDARLYRHETVCIPDDLPKGLMFSYKGRNMERLPLPISFLSNFKNGSRSGLDSMFRVCNNAYDRNVMNLPIVSRTLSSRCLMGKKPAENYRGEMHPYLMIEITSAAPYKTVPKQYDHEVLLTSEYCLTPQSASVEMCNKTSDSLSSVSDEDVENYVKDKNGNVGNFNPSTTYQKEERHSYGDVRNRGLQRHVSSETYVHNSANRVEYETPQSGMKGSRVVNKLELLEVDENYLVDKFTISKPYIKIPETFKKLVKPTVDDLVERNWWLMSRFICTTGRRVECKPRRVIMTGKGGLAWQQSQEAYMTRVKSKVFRKSSFDYFRDNPYSIEHLRGMQKLLFPPRSLLHDDCGKFLVLGRLLNKLKDEGHRCLLYTQFSKMLDILENWINYMGFTYVRLDGSTKVDMRQRIVTRFNENTKIFLFISSTRAGGVGLTLTGADTVIFYDTDWNPAMDRQAMDRCHRIGQTREVNVYRLVSEHTVEENIWRKQLQKRRLDDIVVDKGNFDSEHHDWFSNVDTLMTILKSQNAGGPDDEDIYGKKVLHESEAPPPVEQKQAGSSKKLINMLVEAEDEDDSKALLNRTKETETIDMEFQMDFNTDLVSTIPSLVAYCIQFLLQYKTPALIAQKEEMAIKIQAEEYDSAVTDDDESDSEAGSGSDPEEEEEANSAEDSE
ncbi:helicase srcap-related [Babesia gibsoni]|uniref:Helicase srcap-related n=1 Tax=Babesia gibsoni TaxID=33632 RepID=A0AAD8LQR4_BABGI|nr:helicase srcap-related [Babesia gibsoni]